MSIAEKFETIADAVYEKGELIGYENGRNEGLEEGYASGVIEGKEAEWRAFWETYQNKGNNTNYAYAFYGSTWTDALYKPLKQINGVDITFKVYNTCNGMYQGTYITDTLIPIDISGDNVGTSTTYMFYSATRLKKINKLIVKESNVFTSGFGYCKALTDIEFEGTIGRSISFADCPLAVKSMKSIITHLNKYDAKSYTLTVQSTSFANLETAGFTDDDKALLNGKGIAVTDESTWAAVVDDLNWNLVLA